jgi:hypothetical protein
MTSSLSEMTIAGTAQIYASNIAQRAENMSIA